MKLSTVATLACALGSASAFVPSAPTSSTRTGDLALSAVESDRRSAFGTIGAALVGGAAAAFLSAAPLPASAAANYERQWLTEPTDEFLANEARAAEFKREQIRLKVEFQKAIDKLVKESTTEEELRGDLEYLQDLVARTGGLPAGIKKEELYKQIRSKKAKGFWPTSVEYAYQQLIFEVAFQQSPNKDKELGRP